jgi:hypothetical protein
MQRKRPLVGAAKKTRRRLTMIAPDQFYPDRRPHIRATFDTSDPDQSRSLRILKEADASGAFGSDGFRCQQLGPELYAVEFYPGGALSRVNRQPPFTDKREATA